MRFLVRVREHGAALALIGQVGVGKTAVVEATLAGAREGGFLVLSARGAPFESSINFAALNQLLSPVAERTAELGSEDAAILAAALGGQNTWSPTATDLVADAVIRLVDLVSAGAPALLAVDDLQWVDRATTEVLISLARRVDTTRLGVLIASRSTRETSAVPGLHRTVVSPLDDVSSAVLLDQLHPGLAPRARARVLRQAGGFPIGLLELPEALTDSQREGRASLPCVLAPGPRLHALFAPFERLLEFRPGQLILLAALDGAARLDTLSRAAGIDLDLLRNSHDLVGALDSEAVQLERVGTPGERLTFRHPLVRNVVVDAAGSAQLRAAHRALASAHENDPARQAEHLAEATSSPDDALADRLEGAAATLMQRGQAGRAFDALVASGELSTTQGHRQRRVAAAAYLGIDVMGDLPRVAALLDHSRRDSPHGSLATVVAAAKALFVGDADLQVAHNLLAATLTARDDDGNDLSTKDRVAALYSLFKVGFFASRSDMWPTMRRAAGELGPAVPVDLQLMLEVLADPARTNDTALARLDQELTAVAGVKDPATIERLGTVAAFVDRSRPLRTALREVLQDGRAEGAVTSAVHAATALWADAYLAGEWDACADLTAEGLDLCDRHGLHLPATLLHYGAGLVAAGRGDVHRAERIATSLDRWAAPRGMRTLQRFGWHVRALSACGSGDFAGAHHWFRRISPGGTVPPHAPQALWMVLELVESSVRSGEHQYASAYVRSLTELNVARISTRVELVVAGAEALIADPRRAGELFEAALRTPQASEWPFDVARIRLAFGEHLRRRRATVAARQQLREALDLFDQLGATPWAKRATVELRAAGSSEQVAALADQARLEHGLTPQELQVATLVAVGLTNKQIAERLQLSPRTVAAHLRQVFPKLEISSRAAMHDALAGRAPVGGPT